MSNKKINIYVKQGEGELSVQVNHQPVGSKWGNASQVMALKTLAEYDEWAAKQRELVKVIFEPEPKPCPFEKSHISCLPEMSVVRDEYWKVVCGCGAQGPGHGRREKAVRAWNEAKR